MQDPLKELMVLLPQCLGSDPMLRSEAVTRAYTEDCLFIHPWLYTRGRHPIDAVMAKWEFTLQRHAVHIHSIVMHENIVYIHFTQHITPWWANYGRFPPVPAFLNNWTSWHVQTMIPSYGYSTHIESTDIPLDCISLCTLTKTREGLYQIAAQRDYFLTDPLLPLALSFWQSVLVWPFAKILRVTPDAQKQARSYSWATCAEIGIKVMFSKAVVAYEGLSSKFSRR